MTGEARHILVVGCGSAGKRHMMNLADRGCRVSGVDPRADRRAEADERFGLVGGFETVEAALDAGEYDGAVVASPPHVHVEQSLRLIGRGLPLLLEKPVAPDLESAERLARAARDAEVPVLLGYTYRWWPPVREFRRAFEQRRLGRPLRIAMTMAAHLADWHPWERYQDFFMASAEQGGGALLDESHFLDLMLWIVGWPATVSATVETLSGLEIETDDNVELNFGYADGPRVVIHLDLYTRPHERSIRAYGSDGTLVWSYEENAVSLYRPAAQAWETRSFDCERNEMFAAEADEYLRVLAGGAEPSCTLEDGVRVLRLVEAVRESARAGRTVRLDAADAPA